MADIKVDELSDAIMNALMNYADDIEEKTKAAIDKKTNEVIRSLRRHPNVLKLKDGTGYRMTKNGLKYVGNYKKGFIKRTVYEGKGYKINRISNKKYRIIHLLEDRHLTRNGTSRSRAFPHWKSAQAEVDKFTEELRKELST